MERISPQTIQLHQGEGKRGKKKKGENCEIPVTAGRGILVKWSEETAGRAHNYQKPRPMGKVIVVSQCDKTSDTYLSSNL